MSDVVAIIPARGGSKGVPRKNLRRVGGIPLIGRAIQAARRCDLIDRVCVSTDDDEIAAVGEEWGAEVIRRPAHLSGDTASSESAILHALDELEARDVNVGVVVFLQATSPFIDSEALASAIRLVQHRRRDSVFSAIETYGFLWRKGTGDCAEAINHQADHRPRRQEREPHYLETGAFYVMRARGFRTVRHRFFGSVGIAAVPERTAIEIDSFAELEVARALAPLIDAPEPLDVDAVVTDFDGVHTDDTVTVTESGVEAVRVSRSDGMGVARLRRAHIPFLILSTEENPVVGARARKLRVEVLQGVDDKAGALRSWADAARIPLSRIAYLGNDVNDVPAMDLVGWPVAVGDADPVVLSAARVVLDRRGGDGAVRELAERVLRARRGSTPVPALHENRTTP
ncbi:N-acylneuraminate cytidylyltransferase [Microbacterium sp. AK009]|uniref:acylneuraminate cytidylyltransferase n=1 Tax=Microbacterium sp. AK009 TaxID=2723068 RepID=UPI0015CA8580|nr:acylneuraminate cytidylyltransferase [Microbacterium sp. AK009]NYF16281.1 N-acylneuraminate cytidylyltransferase [Microbacterium sp. AK009]